MQFPASMKAEDPRIAQVLTLMMERLSQPLTVAELAAAADLSSSRLSHLFRQQTGLPPLRYLQILRMTHARVLLVHTSLTVKETMAAVGFSDPSHFARTFRRFHGVTARAIRRGRQADRQARAADADVALTASLRLVGDAGRGRRRA